MSMRGLVDGLIGADAELMAIIPQDRWIENWRDDIAPARPFAEYRWGTVSPSVTPRNPVRSCVLTIYVHDDQGSFDSKINPVIRRLKVVLGEASSVIFSEATLLQADWQEDGDDLYDDGYRTAVRFTRYRIIGSGF